MLKRQKLLIIDGFNVLRNCSHYASVAGTAPKFRDWTTEHWNSAREALLNDVLGYIDKNICATIVYDAANRVDNYQNNFTSSQKINNVNVVFTKPGQSADTYIQNLIHTAREMVHDITVVTNDRQIQDATIGKHVARMSSREFGISITDQKTEQKQLSKSPAQKGDLLENIVDKKTAEKLRKLRDSL